MLNINSKIIEGTVTLPYGSNKIDIKTIEDMRDFLEKMYFFCISPPNDTTTDKIKNSKCFKVTILGTYLWPSLGPYTYWSLGELTNLFGVSVKPTSQTEKIAQQQNTTPPPVPIIMNDMDYQLFIQLALLGQFLEPFTTTDWNGWNSAIVWFKDNRNNPRDGCLERWGEARGSVALLQLYFKQIQTILTYFHSQTDTNNTIHSGDSIYTTSYSLYSDLDDTSESLEDTETNSGTWDNILS
jgi:hypothetical protein